LEASTVRFLLDDEEFLIPLSGCKNAGDFSSRLASDIRGSTKILRYGDGRILPEFRDQSQDYGLFFFGGRPTLYKMICWHRTLAKFQGLWVNAGKPEVFKIVGCVCTREIPAFTVTQRQH